MWIQTFTGRKFDLFNPRPQDVCIEDVAHALANICRFGGHCNPAYSVAQHSVHVADMVPAMYRRAGLLHDAAEAYYGDMCRPFKLAMHELTKYDGRCGEATPFKWFLDKIDLAVAAALRIPYPLPACVRNADNVMLATEARDLMGPPPEPWVKMPDPLSHKVTPWPRDEAFAQFMRIYEES